MNTLFTRPGDEMPLTVRLAEAFGSKPVTSRSPTGDAGHGAGVSGNPKNSPGATSTSSTDLKLTEDETSARPGPDSSDPESLDQVALVAAGSEVDHPLVAAGEAAGFGPSANGSAAGPEGLGTPSDELEGGGVIPPIPPSSGDPREET